jgi:putative alpha-1,2-mannosidase
MIGSPLFQQVRLHLGNGKTFVISAPANSEKNMYIESAELNGKPLTIPMLCWEQIQQGGTLTFAMGRAPSQWGANWHPAPLER